MTEKRFDEKLMWDVIVTLMEQIEGKTMTVNAQNIGKELANTKGSNNEMATAVRKELTEMGYTIK